MIRELSELGKTVRRQKTENEWVHDALKEEIISLILTINSDGSFISLQSIEKKKTMAEAIQRTSGKESRLLLDNCGYVLGVYDCDGNAFKKKVKEKGEQKAHEILKKDVTEKLNLFLNRLNEVSDIDELKPVLKFYNDNRQQGIDIINQDYFLKNISKKYRGGNIAILVLGQIKYAHESDSIYRKIINKYEIKQQELVSSVRIKCAICGEDKFPVGDFPHFPIKGAPGDKEPAGGRKLISYNGDNNPFESYEMVGNENCMICTNCAKTYVEGLNWLLSIGTKAKNKKGKEYTAYTNRKNFGSDTAIVFWTKENAERKEIDLLDTPDSQEVLNLIDSVTNGNESNSRYIETDMFYSCTLSGSAARIVVRDWIETSLNDFRKNIAKWFQDIAIDYFDYDLKKNQTHYSKLYELARSCQNEKEDKETTLSRTATYLWDAALKNTLLPSWILASVLKQARLVNTDENKKKYDGITRERASLIRLILNRNKNGGEYMIQEKLDCNNISTSYVCGRIFAVLESIQRAALGKNINAGIRERFFSFASTNPSPAFGRLIKLSQNHLSKLKGENPGLAVVLDKELGELVCKIQTFPVIFSLEEQGQFAIGYYHQKQAQFNRAELKETLEEE